MSSDDNFINVEDFDSLELDITLKNNTTNTTLKKGNTLRAVELLEKGFVLESEERFCADGHNLSIKVIGKKSKKILMTFETTARASNVTESESGSVQAQIEFIQYDEEAWTTFQNYFSARQSAIEEFMVAARGW